MKKRLLIALKIFPWAALSLVLIYVFFLQGWRDITFGRAHRIANDFFVNFHYIGKDHPHPVTKVEIFLLQGHESQLHDGTFPVPGSRDTGRIYGKMTLATEDITQFLELWTTQEIDYWKSAMCHHPAYGIRIYEGSRMTRETSMCWHCSNFSIPLPPLGPMTYGFDAEGKPAQDFLKFCDERLPYPKSSPAETGNKDEGN